MAFQKSFGERVGRQFASAYHLLSGINIDVVNSKVYIQVDIYIDKQNRDNNNGLLERKVYVIENWVDYSGETPVPHNDFNDFFTAAPIDATTVKDVLLKNLYQWIKANITFYGSALEV